MNVLLSFLRFSKNAFPYLMVLAACLKVANHPGRPFRRQHYRLLLILFKSPIAVFTSSDSECSLATINPPLCSNDTQTQPFSAVPFSSTGVL